MNGEHKAGDGAAPRGLLKATDLRKLLGISERKFHELRAASVIGPGVDLGPRTQRWTWTDFEEIVGRLPRRERAPEPSTLQQGRRARIESMKATTPSTQP